MIKLESADFESCEHGSMRVYCLSPKCHPQKQEKLGLFTADELMTYLTARCKPGTLREVARRLLDR